MAPVKKKSKKGPFIDYSNKGTIIVKNPQVGGTGDGTIGYIVNAAFPPNPVDPNKPAYPRPTVDFEKTPDATYVNGTVVCFNWAKTPGGLYYAKIWGKC